jgi:hypothetical protein
MNATQRGRINSAFHHLCPWSTGHTIASGTKRTMLGCRNCSGARGVAPIPSGRSVGAKVARPSVRARHRRSDGEPRGGARAQARLRLAESLLPRVQSPNPLRSPWRSEGHPSGGEDDTRCDVVSRRRRAATRHQNSLRLRAWVFRSHPNESAVAASLGSSPRRDVRSDERERRIRLGSSSADATCRCAISSSPRAVSRSAETSRTRAPPNSAATSASPISRPRGERLPLHAGRADPGGSGVASPGVIVGR